MDFYQINVRNTKEGVDIYPDFIVGRSKDLMVRGRLFYAIWDDEKQIWSTDEFDVQRLVDQELEVFRKKYEKKHPGEKVSVKKMSRASTKMWSNYKYFVSQMPDNAHPLDEAITFTNTERKKTDYSSRVLPYALEKGDCEAYEEIISTLYSPEERAKLEWAIGSIVSGDSKDIQKFVVLYGEAGTGKSTVLNIIQKLFYGYYCTFEAKALASANSEFSLEMFKSNPLIALQHDGDLSRIEDNTKLNSIVAHEEMTMNEKHKSKYTFRSNAFLFLGTNKPVKITDAKSGIIRRLIDVRPTGNKIPTKRYHALMSQVEFELGAIAWRCLETYREMGKNYYSSYRPLDMMFQTDVFFNFVEANYHIFKEQNGVALLQAYEMYKTYCTEALIEFKLPRHKFREELKSYFEKFEDICRHDGKQVRSFYSGFLDDKFSVASKEVQEKPYSLVMESTVSLLDEMLASSPAQYASDYETPSYKWGSVKTTLSDLNTQNLHYVQPPQNHIVIDFDLKNKDGKKSMEMNLEAAAKWPTTYAEFSKSGAGIHLHYIYDGDISKLHPLYSEGIEVKTFPGNSSLRRKLSKCNNSPVAHIKSGLPLKGERMINTDAVLSEKGLRDLIARNLRKEIHPGTKPSIDFIDKILSDACKSGMHYDVTDLRPKILAFANNSSHQADYCIKLVNKMQFKSDEPSLSPENYDNDDLIFYDVEVFPNLFVVVWKKEGGAKVKMINPTASQIEELLKFKLVGFNCRRYDNHIMYARYIGYDNLQLYELSQRIINESRNCLFGEAYNLSYTDVYDFSSKKQGLKKFEIELGIHHQELGLPWDQPVPENLWDLVADYCGNDVDATEAVFVDRKQDFIARQILADLSGLTPNDTTQMHTAKIIFGDDKRPQDKFVYTDLSEMFPGYVYENGKSTYRGEEVGEGGYVYAEPGMYSDVPVLDVESMHPHSIVLLNLFGPYTKNFEDLLNARLAIKHKDYDKAKTMLGGILEKYLTNADDAKKLSYALKIIINIVYGLTSAKFENKFRDPRNKDNIVAKRGALFMIDLKHAVQEKGFTVAHIKTDSIKIPNATLGIIDFVRTFGKQYGYDFEHEETYSRFCLVNDSVYIARIKGDENPYYDMPPGEQDLPQPTEEWTATGAQFAQPYVFKTLFSREPIEFKDMCETKTVTSALYLDMNERLKDDDHDYHFVGKAGSFCPIKPGCGGGVLLREKDGKYYAATGSKGYRWLEAEMVQTLGREADIDRSYYDKLVEDAVEDISKFGDFEWFRGYDSAKPKKEDLPPWSPLGCGKYDCVGCPHWGTARDNDGRLMCDLGHDCLPF